MESKTNDLMASLFINFIKIIISEIIPKVFSFFIWK